MAAVDLPDSANLKPTSYNLQRQLQLSGIKGGIMQVVDDGPAYWVVSYESTGHFTDAEYGAWQAWFDSLRGGIVLFNAWVRNYPIRYPNGSYPGGFGGVAAVLVNGGNSLTIKNLVDGLELVPGDVFTILGPVDRLYRVSIGGVADLAGELTVTVEPEIHPTIAVDDVINFTKPHFTAQIQPDIEYGSPVLGRRTIGFRGVQRLKL